MKLWKLWIVPSLLASPIDVYRASMKPMDEVEVPQADIATVPSTLDPPVVLLDVREDDEWRRGHAPGAQHIPMGQIPARLAEIDPAATLFVVCQAGGRSQRVAQYLARKGYAPVNVTGGMTAWAGAGRPVITDGGDVGVV
jgi:rhodanese-related sulfurtransferase